MAQAALAENKGMDMIEMAVGELSKQVTNEAIAELSKKYMVLKINGLEDKKGYEAVHAARMDVVKRRTTVEKKRKELKADALRFGKAVDDEAKRINSLLSPIENHLEAEENAIVQEKARIQAEKEKAEQARIQERVNRLYEMGCRFDGQKFSLPFAPEGYSIPHPLLKAVNDEQFETFCGELQKLVDAENERLAEIERQRKAEEARLAKIREEQEAEAARLAEIARKQEEEAARIKAEQEAAERKLREEREALEREKKAIEDAKLKEEAEKKRQAELEQARKEAAEKAAREAEEKAQREAEAKAAREAAEKEEAARQEALKPDKEKLLRLAEALEIYELPTLKNKKPIAILTTVKDRLNDTARMIREEVGQLTPRKGVK